MLPTGFLVSRRTQDLRSLNLGFAYGSLTLSGCPSHDIRLPLRFVRVLLPHHMMVWAPPLSLAATYGISFDFFSCRYLDVSVPCVSPLSSYVFAEGCMSLAHAGFPIRTSPDLRLLTAPRCISVFAPSFFASVCPGFRHTPFLS